MNPQPSNSDQKCEHFYHWVLKSDGMKMMLIQKQTRPTQLTRLKVNEAKIGDQVEPNISSSADQKKPWIEY
ncbi:hypothetical protein NPIL_317361 [Nephila pilipes]|uniref:Uncharacterized protein n=1 Tax=Nephila pilipes TaxID=299642 RepID=A0A8X6JW75_NEPPI|nr:hypothetical protein NPIL_317361 [Nephila pilipes]